MSNLAPNSRGSSPSRAAALHNLQEIPGVGPSIAHDLWRLGVGAVGDLKGADPQKLYDRLCELKKAKVDRCCLYVFRCAVYYASRKRHDPEKLKWWNWADDQIKRKRS
ncbi:MAG: helix-hairpin-helix domain-containing protein [Candidatus Aminicenantes bacterium]|nr:helix-hairpin-helix domain-containing protein [Candidatus Aminicenantes bacterium]